MHQPHREHARSKPSIKSTNWIGLKVTDSRFLISEEAMRIIVAASDFELPKNPSTETIVNEMRVRLNSESTTEAIYFTDNLCKGRQTILKLMVANFSSFADTSQAAKNLQRMIRRGSLLINYAAMELKPDTTLVWAHEETHAFIDRQGRVSRVFSRELALAYQGISETVEAMCKGSSELLRALPSELLNPEEILVRYLIDYQVNPPGMSGPKHCVLNWHTISKAIVAAAEKLPAYSSPVRKIQTFLHSGLPHIMRRAAVDETAARTVFHQIRS